jgi:hypothetical protein
MSRYDPTPHENSVRSSREGAWNPAAEDGFPQDLRQWVGESALLSWVLDAVQSICEPGGRASGGTTPVPVGQPRVFLTLLTYCYAVGVYASEEIEDRIPTDATLCYLSAGARPTWHDLRHFRRQTRKMLHQALSKVFQTAREFRLWSIANMLQIDADWRDRLAVDSPRESRQTQLADLAANDRINQAVLRDSMALDE